mmetsp:Transcript_19844/g.31581  ORF Transcript_19844/g.31581 Transcript_19844/m.31581 type:complete len:222 (+) Transcript_19844:23-688(+)
MAQTSTSSQAKEVTFMLFGDSNVGKTAILRKFAGEQIPVTHAKTEQEECKSRSILIEDDMIAINVYDSPNEDGVDADAWIFVYDVTNKQSFENIKELIKQKRANAQSRGVTTPVLMVLANKTDLKERVVSYDDGQEFCDAMNVPLFYQLSMKKDSGLLSQAMVRLTSKVIQHELHEHQRGATHFSNVLTVRNTLILSGLCAATIFILYYTRKYYKNRNQQT